MAFSVFDLSGITERRLRPPVRFMGFEWVLGFPHEVWVDDEGHETHSPDVWAMVDRGRE